MIIRLEMKNYSTILIEKLPKYQPYHQAKLISMNTGQETLPSNQKQIIEQAKFTYSPLGKAFEKQIKTIEDQRKKQVKALEYLKPKKLEANKDKSDDTEMPSMNKEIFNKLSRERIGEIYNISKEIDFNNLTCYFKSLDIAPIKFIGFRGSLNICEDIKYGNVLIEKMEKEQEQLKSKLNEITVGRLSQKINYVPQKY